MTRTRQTIGTRIHSLRVARAWSQAELARQIGVSQNQLSRIEHGLSSLTAEQFLLLLKRFNVGADHFVDDKLDRAIELQNALARLGAFHLQEDHDVFPSERLREVQRVIREAIVEGSPRIITAAATVLVRNADVLHPASLYEDVSGIGLGRRLGWLAENTLVALGELRDRRGGRDWVKAYGRVETLLPVIVDIASEELRRSAVPPPLDVLDATIRSQRTLNEVEQAASPISKHWRIVTDIRPTDFMKALEAARSP